MFNSIVDFFKRPQPKVNVFIENPIKNNTIENEKSNLEKKNLKKIFSNGDSISGKVNILIGNGYEIEHYGISVEFIGRIEFDNGSYEDFCTHKKSLASSGILTKDSEFEFLFQNVEMEHDSFQGKMVKLKYYVLGKIEFFSSSSIFESVEIQVQNLTDSNLIPKEITSEVNVGIEQSIEIKLVFNSLSFELNGLIIGSVIFKYIEIPIIHGEISLKYQEIIEPNIQSSENTITNFEILDGCPSVGDEIPIRFPLQQWNLYPTMTKVFKRFSVNYFLYISFITEDGSRIFKKIGIKLYRAEF